VTPKEFGFMVATIEAASKAAYLHREEETRAGKTLNPNQFFMKANSRLILHSQLEKHLKNAKRGVA